MAGAKSKADVDPNFENQLHALRDLAGANGDALQTGGPTTWMRPDGWNGNPFDYDGISKVFNRDQANREFTEAIKDARTPGTAADLIATTTQIDCLASLERGFRLRHAMPRIRCLLHAAGTKKGQGQNEGAFTLCGLDYVRRVVKQGKS